MSARSSILTLPGARIRTERQGMLDVEEPENGARGVVLAVHGSGRGIADYRDVPFYAEQRKIALGYGFAFAVLENGPDTYGTDDGVYNLDLAVRELCRLFSRDRLALWAVSAGGAAALRFTAARPEAVSAFIGTFPVADLNSVFPLLPSCRRAWHAEGMTPEEFAERIRGRNPPDLSDQLTGVPMFVSHGLRDRAVPYSANAAFLQKIGAEVHTLPDGVHGTEDRRYYGVAPHRAFAYLTHEK